MKNKDKLIQAVSAYANRKNISMDSAISELNKMSKDEINNIFNKMKFFKDGGKLDYLLCLKKGGDMKKCGCGGNVEKKQSGGNVRDMIKWNQPTIKGYDTTAVGFNPLGQKFVATGTTDGRSLQRITDNGASAAPIITKWKQNRGILDKLVGVKPMSNEQYNMLSSVLKNVKK